MPLFEYDYKGDIDEGTLLKVQIIFKIDTFLSAHMYYLARNMYKYYDSTSISGLNYQTLLTLMKS